RLHERVTQAVGLVETGGVWVESEGTTAYVRSRSHADSFHAVNGSCHCEDAQYRAENGLCAHRLAVGLYRRAAELQAHPVLLPDAEAPAGIDPRFLVPLHGKQFVLYAGLLALAHERGLVSLKAHFTSVSSELALAVAEATFADGRVFVEAADASPANCGAQVRAAYPRIALTRAKGRALRDALNITMCTLEELGEDGGGA